MNSKKQILKFSILSLVGLIVGYIIPKTNLILFCPWNSIYYSHSCGYVWFKLSDALTYGIGALFIIFVVLYLMPQAFNAWKKFAIWFVPLATLVFIFTPEPQGFDLLTPYPEQVFQWVSAIYVIVSLLIIGWSVLKKG